MKHPDSADIHAAMNLLTDVVSQEKSPHLDMDEIRVKSLGGSGGCGTVACFGGWYAYAKMRDEISAELRH